MSIFKKNTIILYSIMLCFSSSAYCTTKPNSNSIIKDPCYNEDKDYRAIISNSSHLNKDVRDCFNRYVAAEGFENEDIYEDLIDDIGNSTILDAIKSELGIKLECLAEVFKEIFEAEAEASGIGEIKDIYKEAILSHFNSNKTAEQKQNYSYQYTGYNKNVDYKTLIGNNLDKYHLKIFNTFVNKKRLSNKDIYDDLIKADPYSSNILKEIATDIGAWNKSIKSIIAPHVCNVKELHKNGLLGLGAIQEYNPEVVGKLRLDVILRNDEFTNNVINNIIKKFPTNKLSKEKNILTILPKSGEKTRIPTSYMGYLVNCSNVIKGNSKNHNSNHIPKKIEINETNIKDLIGLFVNIEEWKKIYTGCSLADSQLLSLLKLQRYIESQGGQAPIMIYSSLKNEFTYYNPFVENDLCPIPIMKGELAKEQDVIFRQFFHGYRYFSYKCSTLNTNEILNKNLSTGSKKAFKHKLILYIKERNNLNRSYIRNNQGYKPL